MNCAMSLKSRNKPTTYAICLRLFVTVCVNLPGIKLNIARDIKAICLAFKNTMNDNH